MAKAHANTDAELRGAVEALRAAVANLASRLERLETLQTAPAVEAGVGPVVRTPPPTVAPDAAPTSVVPDGIHDEVLVVLSAAVAAFLGERAHVRQVRLISSSAWAQQGRVSVQASHRLAR